MVIFFVLAVSSHGTTTNCDGSRRSMVAFTCYTCHPTTYGGLTQSSTTSESVCRFFVPYSNYIFYSFTLHTLYIQQWHSMLPRRLKSFGCSFLREIVRFGTFNSKKKRKEKNILHFLAKRGSKNERYTKTNLPEFI